MRNAVTRSPLGPWFRAKNAHALGGWRSIEFLRDCFVGRWLYNRKWSNKSLADPFLNGSIWVQRWNVPVSLSKPMHWKWRPRRPGLGPNSHLGVSLSVLPLIILFQPPIDGQGRIFLMHRARSFRGFLQQAPFWSHTESCSGPSGTWYIDEFWT